MTTIAALAAALAAGLLTACAYTGDDRLGQELTVRVRAGDVANDAAFWVEQDGRRILVVVNRDRRSDAQRHGGVPAMHGIAIPDADVPVLVIGRVEPLPHREAMYSWRLTDADSAALRGQSVYLRAERVRAAP